MELTRDRLPVLRVRRSPSAARHADVALALADQWEVPVVAGWIRETQKTYGY